MKRFYIFFFLLLIAIIIQAREFVFLQELEHGTVSEIRDFGPLFHDFNRNGSDELIMWTFFGDGADTANLYFYELLEDYSFNLIQNNKYYGTMWTAGIGDCDNDGLYEILGGDPDSQFIYLMEQTDSFDLPDSITWHSSGTWESFYPMIVTNKLKPDSIDRIAGMGIPGISTTVYGKGFYYFECDGDNSYYMKTFAESTRVGAGSFDIGDINENGLAEVYCELLDAANIVRFEATDSLVDSFVLLDSTYTHIANNILVIEDTDGDGKQELLQERVNYSGGGVSSYGFDLYEDDNGDGSLDSVWATDFDVYTTNDIIHGGDIDYGDIDGDGQLEIVICGGRHFEAWKSTANNTYSKIFEWTNPDYNTIQSHIRCHDFNKNGIDEIIYSGSGTYIGDEGTFIFECRPLSKLDYTNPSIMDNHTISTVEYDSIYLRALDELPVVIDSMKLKNGYNISIVHPSYPCSVPAYDSLPILFDIYSDTSTFITDSLIIYSDDWFGNVDTVTIYSGVAAEIIIDSAVASDNRNAQSGIDYDDYVKLYFNNPIIPPDTRIIDLDSILLLSLGHTWYDGTGNIRQLTCVDNNSSMYVFLSTNTSTPTVSIGDTIYPDSLTITDNRGYTYLSKPVVIKGSFGPAGIDQPSAVGYQPSASLTINYEQSILSIVSPIQSGLIIYDITGRQIMNRTLSQGNHTISISNIPSGIYFIKFNNINQKILLLK